MDTREAKALEIAARMRLEYRDGAWHVPSQSGGGVYRVTLRPESCACEDFALRAQACKHVIAARLVQERDCGGQAPAIDTDVLPKKKTYRQDWPAYDQAQMTEKKRFLALLHDLCRGVEDPPQPKTGRRRTAMADMVFASAFKVYSTVSARRFACDLADAHKQGYVSQRMHSVSVCAYLESELMTPVLHGLIRKSALPLSAVETTFAPDSSGFSTSRFVRWFDEKYGCERSGHAWVKAHAICGVKTNIVTAVEIAGPDAADCPMFKPLVEATAENFAVKEVCADKAYLSRENLELVTSLGATAYVPFKSNSVAGEAGTLWEKMFFYYSFRREEFLRHYHQRSNAESTFAMLKAKFRDHVRSRSDTAMTNEVLCKFLCHNLCVIHQSQTELGIEPVFWQDERATTAPVTLPFTRPVCKKTP
jgi:transposase